MHVSIQFMSRLTNKYHIDHHALIQDSVVTKPKSLKSGYVCYYDFRVVALTLKDFEIFLLRKELKQKQQQILVKLTLHQCW